MPDTPIRCTCGTFLVENAAFCHRCGRPLHAQAVAEQEALHEEEQQKLVQSPAAAPTVAIPQPPAPISFGNPIAVRVAFLMSLGILMTSFVPQVNLLLLVWCLVGGWGGVRLYRRLTGFRLSISAGARLGFLTGVLAFVSLAVVIALAMLSSGKEILDQLTAQMVKQNPSIAEAVNNPQMLGATLIMAMMVMFVVVVGICAAGGALGAKFSPPTEPRA